MKMEAQFLESARKGQQVRALDRVDNAMKAIRPEHLNPAMRDRYALMLELARRSLIRCAICGRASHGGYDAYDGLDEVEKRRRDGDR